MSAAESSVGGGKFSDQNEGAGLAVPRYDGLIFIKLCLKKGVKYTQEIKQYKNKDTGFI